MITLYKCISFSLDYWAYVAKSQSLYFASPEEIRNRNDEAEFTYKCNAGKPLFKDLELHFGPAYKSLYSSVGICSLSNKKSEKSWTTFCPMPTGGVRYEFETSKEILAASAIENGPVEYTSNKIVDLGDFLYRNETDSEILKIMDDPKGLHSGNYYQVFKWINAGKFRELGIRHITDEIPFKKSKFFSDENEHRFVHADIPLKPPIISNRLIGLSHMGLILKRISTNNILKVKSDLRHLNMEVRTVDFLD